MVAVVENVVESAESPAIAVSPGVRVRMLGPLAVSTGGRALALPASRKVRALLAYLALSPVATSRSHLCGLLWDSPCDPRGELRWCLSKIRALVGPGRVLASGETVRLDLADGFVDAVRVARGADAGAGPVGARALRELCALFEGDFLEGLEIERCPSFTAWLLAQRRRFRACHVALLERLADCVGDEEAIGHLETWLRLAPFDRRAHERFLGALARRGWIREGEEHLATAVRHFAQEGLDGAPLREAWRIARTHQACSSLVARWASGRAA